MELLEFKLTVGSLFFFLLISLFAFWVAQRNNFFRLPLPISACPISFVQTLGAFLVYLCFAFFVLPILVFVIAYFIKGDVGAVKNLPVYWLAGFQVGALWVIFFLLVVYCFLIKPVTRRFIFWGQGTADFKRLFKGVGMGILTWLISYPFVLLISLLAKYLTLLLWGEIEVEQAAVKHLKMTMGAPSLFSAMVFAVIFLVPFLEELLFRGFFQNFAKRYLGRNWAIVLTAILFTFAHFSRTQGVGNLQLLSSLFVLALFLSFIYEREKTLWAPIGLHTAFNAWNVLMIILAKDNML